MTDSENERRPVRKLTVKNFSVIKEAELEFGKITVLIGPQASGKSLLCKLVYFFQKIVPDTLAQSLISVEPLLSAQGRVQAEFSKWFPHVGAHPGEMLVRYSDRQYVITVGGSKRADGIGSFSLNFSDEIATSYNFVFKTVQEQMILTGGKVNPIFHASIYGELNSLLSDKYQSVYSYIPSTRAFFVTRQMAIQSSIGGVDPLTSRYSQDLDFNFESKVPRVGLEHKLTNWINNESRRILQGEAVVKVNSEIFQTTDGRELPFSILSSGTQELLPLLTSLREFVALSAAVAETLGFQNALHRRLIFIEEPENSVFPSTQRDLVRVFARMSKESNLDASWVITTHSPYILSAFNNLIEAFQVARAKPELKSEVAKLIDERYWINPEDLKAYSIHDGKLESIIDEETGLISDNYLDQVSETIGIEFDELLRLGYVES